VRPDDSVRLVVTTEVSTAVGEIAGSELTPVIARREITSELTIRSGGTVMLGGLIQNSLALSEGGVPVLREIPLVGTLFGVRGSEVERTELLILLTPRVSRVSYELERITRAVRRELSVD
jgi:general secretion pathway protein D